MNFESGFRTQNVGAFRTSGEQLRWRRKVIKSGQNYELNFGGRHFSFWPRLLLFSSSAFHSSGSRRSRDSRAAQRTHWVMCGRPRCKENLVCRLRSGASHVSGLLMRRMTAGLDVIRRSGPNQIHGLQRPMTRDGFSRSTARPFRITPSSPSQFDYRALAVPCTPIAKPLQAAAASSGAR